MSGAERIAHRAAVEAGYAPLPDYVRTHQAEEITFRALPDLVAALDDYAKRTGCSREIAAAEAMRNWFGLA